MFSKLCEEEDHTYLSRTTYCLFQMFVASRRRHLLAPRKVTARVTSPYSIQVRWRDHGPRAGVKDGRRYLLRYQVPVGPVGPVAGGNTTELPDETAGRSAPKTVRISKRRAKLYGLLPATTYKIDVKVTKGKRSSPWSDVVEVTTLAEDIGKRII